MLKVVITGPESTGKSAISKALSHHYNEPWSKEIARDYLHELNGPYSEDDLHAMAQQQVEEIQKNADSSSSINLCDTDLLTFIIWWEVKYGRCPQKWEDDWKENLPDLYLLMDIDLPWELDPLREHPDRRGELKQRYIDKLESVSARYSIITGQGPARLASAIRAIEEL